MREFEAIGLHGLDDPRPAFDVDVETAMRCWNFCGGWFPERIALFDTIYGGADFEKLVEMMMQIRDNGH